MKNTLRPLCLSLLAMGALSLSAQAADLATASASLSNLRFRLIDLNPGDGIAPSVSFSDTLIGEASTSLTPGLDGRSLYEVTLNPDDLSRNISAPLMGASEPLLIQSTLPGAQSGLGTTLSAQANVTTASLARGLGTVSLTSEYSTVDVNPALGDGVPRNTTVTTVTDYYSLQIDNSSAVYTESGDYGLNVTLSPQTILVVEGNAAVSTVFNDQAFRDAFSTLDSLDPSFAGSSAPNLYAIVSAQLFAFDNTALPGGSSLYESSGSGFTLGEFITPNEFGVTSDQKNFTLTLSNITGGAMSGNLMVNVYARAVSNNQWNQSNTTVVYGDPVGGIDPPTPTIPEPSTYALMALGLVGIAAAARRQRPTQNV